MAQTIKDIMSTDVQWAGPETSIVEAAQQMRDGDFGALPIGKDDKLVGMVTDRDIVTRCIAKTGEVAGVTVSEIMTQKALYCREDQSVDEVAENMGNVQIRRLPVVNANDRLVGIVSLGDMATGSTHRKAGDALQEISAA